MVIRKLKQKCKDAARMRREKERSEFLELSKLLPLPTNLIAQLDKASVIRLTSNHLLIRACFPNGLGQCWGYEAPIIKEYEQNCQSPASRKFNKDLGSLLLQALDGFVFALHRDGKIMYISETASVHLGLPQIDLTGSSIYDYVHPEDHEDIRHMLDLEAKDIDQLNQESKMLESKDYELSRCFSMRMRCILPKRNAGLVSGGYKAIHCSGHLKVRQVTNEISISHKTNEKIDKHYPVSWKSYCLLAVGHSLLPSASTEIKLNTQSFMIQSNLDLKLVFIEAAALDYTGYTHDELIGQNLYQFIYPSDIKSFANSHSNLLDKGQIVTPYIRLICKEGNLRWVQCMANSITTHNCQQIVWILSIIATHSIVDNINTGRHCENNGLSIQSSGCDPLDAVSSSSRHINWVATNDSNCPESNNSTHPIQTMNDSPSNVYITTNHINYIENDCPYSEQASVPNQNECMSMNNQVINTKKVDDMLFMYKYATNGTCNKPISQQMQHEDRPNFTGDNQVGYHYTHDQNSGFNKERDNEPAPAQYYQGNLSLDNQFQLCTKESDAIQTNYMYNDSSLQNFLRSNENQSNQVYDSMYQVSYDNQFWNNNNTYNEYNWCSDRKLTNTSNWSIEGHQDGLQSNV